MRENRTIFRKGAGQTFGDLPVEASFCGIDDRVTRITLA
jgi:hypothetical protein